MDSLTENRERQLLMKLQKIRKEFFLVIAPLLVAIIGAVPTAFLVTRSIAKNVVTQCGSQDRIVRSNEELIVALKTAQNNLPNNGTAQKFSAQNLIDGNFETYAYPNDRILDYTVDLIDLYPLDKVTIIWNEFGEQKNYVAKWYLEGCTKDGKWDILARGGAPKSKVTVVKTEEILSQLRLRASAERDWIGVYEMKIE